MIMCIDLIQKLTIVGSTISFVTGRVVEEINIVIIHLLVRIQEKNFLRGEGHKTLQKETLFGTRNM